MALPSDASTLNEAQARYVLIDPALEKSGWNLSDRTQVGFEVPVDGYDAEPWNGVTDYCLFDPSGDVLAVIEAKRTCRSPREGEEQLRHYLTEIAKRQGFVPFGFMTNGLNWHFWDYLHEHWLTWRAPNSTSADGDAPALRRDFRPP